MQQAFPDLDVSDRIQAYLEFGGQLRLDRSQHDVQLTTPVKAAANLHGSARWTLYAAADVSPDWIGSAAGSCFSQVGIGSEFRPAPAWEIEALATTFPRGRTAGAGRALSAGVRWVR